MKTSVYADMHRYEELFWWHVGMKKISRTLLNTHLLSKKNLAILDVGCGTGGMFPLLREYGSIIGIDNAPEAVQYARERNLATSVEEGDVQKLPFQDNSFDLVVCYDVIYHTAIADDQAVLNECARVLRPGGTLLVRVAAFDWLRGKHDELVATKHRYTRPEVEQKVTAANLKLVKSTYANFFLFPLAIVARSLEALTHSGSEQAFKPPFILNHVFKAVLFCEAFLLRFISFPCGLSVITVARKQP